jgi:hypothetical protein
MCEVSILPEDRWGRGPERRPPKFQGRPRGGRWERRGERGGPRELRPRPLGDKCNPLCPFFRCARNALRIKTEYFKGRPIRVAYCELAGDRCIGASCKFAQCAKNALLPDGRCGFVVNQKKRPVKDFEEELRELEESEKKFRFRDDYF